MTLGHYARLVLRESRRSRARILLFMGCIAVGVAAIVLVAGLSTSVREGIRAEGRRLMSADVTIEGRRELPADLDAIIDRFPTAAGTRVERAYIRELVSIVLSPDNRSSQLVELKVVDNGYPFYGQLVLDPQGRLSDLLTPDSVVVAPELLSRLNLKVGDELRIGGAPFRIAAAVLQEPDKLSVSFTLGPRVFISHPGLKRTALLGIGSRIEFRALLKLPDGSTDQDARRLQRHLEASLPDADAYRVRSFTDAQPALRRSFDRVGRYLGLVGLLSLLIGGVGVAQVTRAWLASRMDDIAILRCLGATPREVVLVYLAQVVALAVIASLAGAAIGTGLHWLLPQLLPDLIPPDLVSPWQAWAIARGIGLGVAVAVIFTLPLLAGLRRVPPARVLRRDAEPIRAGWFGQAVGAAIVLAGIWTTASTQSQSTRYGTIFTAGIVGAILVLALAAMLISRLARLLPRDVGGVRLRHGLAHLARPGATTVGAIVALGLGVTFVFATWLVERHLTEQMQAELPVDAPSTFFVDVQPDQWPGVREILERAGAIGIDSRPIITGRFAAIDGVPIDELTNRNADRAQTGPDGTARERQRPQGWILRRELRITYGDSLPRGNRVIAGTFPSGQPGGVSIESGFAADLGVDVGSTLTLDIQGVPVDLTVTSLRTIDWRTMGINFFMWAEPGPLDEAPQQRLAVARLESADLPRVQADIVSAYPNVTVIHVRDVMEKIVAVLSKIGLGIRALGAFTVAAGVIVLGGTVAATQARRAREVALFKAIGMTRADVVTVFAVEYALTGMAAAVVGTIAGGLLAWGVLTRLMELPWKFSLLEASAAIALTMVLAIGAGLVASARALRARPAEVLRSD